MRYISFPFLPNVQGSLQKRQQKDCKSQESVSNYKETLTSGHNREGSCTYEITVLVTVYTRSVQLKSDQILTVAEELLANDRCWERESSFSLRVWPLIGKPHSGEY